MENLKEEFTNNEEFRNSVLTTVKDNGYQLYKQDEFDEVVKNKANTYVNNEVSNALKTNHTKLEESVFNIVGEAKNQDEKSYDYAARHLEALKLKVEELNNKITSTDSGDELLRQQVEKLTADLNSKSSEFDQYKQTKDTEVSNMLKTSMFDAEASKLRFDPKFDQELIASAIEIEKSKLLSNSKLENNEFLILGDDGNILTDGSNAHKPFALSNYLSNKFEKYLQKEPATGTGIKPNGEGRKTAISDAETFIRAKRPQSKVDVMRAAREYATQKGLNEMTDKEIIRARNVINQEIPE